MTKIDRLSVIYGVHWIFMKYSNSTKRIDIDVRYKEVES